MLGIGAADDHALRVFEDGGADLGDLGRTLAGSVDDLGDALASCAARVEDGELVEVADLALPQMLGGLGGGERAAGDRG